MTTAERIDMCTEFSQCEGTEIGDALGALCVAARVLNGLADDYHAQITLLTAEDICRKSLEWIRNEADYETYSDIPDKVFAHFAGGAKKLTEKEWNERFGNQ